MTESRIEAFAPPLQGAHRLASLCRPVTHIGIVKWHVASGNFLHSHKRLARAIDKVIQRDDGVPCIQQLNAGVRADITGGAGNQNSFIGCHAFDSEFK